VVGSFDHIQFDSLTVQSYCESPLKVFQNYQNNSKFVVAFKENFVQHCVLGSIVSSLQIF
jgi:hypothetical protein